MVILCLLKIKFTVEEVVIMGDYVQALGETLLMVGVSSFVSIAIGLPLGIILVFTSYGIALNRVKSCPGYGN